MDQTRVVAAGLTDRGQVRPNNEDAFFISPADDLFLVADGMGGHAGGEVASGTIVQTVTAAVAEGPVGDDPASALTALLERADEAVRQKAVGDLVGMGSTAVTLFLRQDRFWIAHAGDSRAYRLRGEDLQRLTTDHTPEAEGGGPPGSFRSGMITRAVGIGPRTSFDITEGSAAAGDRFLLCSDGLTDAVADPVIARELQAAPDPETAAAQLVATANAAGGPDNVTVVVVWVG